MWGGFSNPPGGGRVENPSHIRHVDVLLHDGLGVRLRVRHLHAQLVRAAREQAVDHDRQHVQLRVGGKIEAVAVLLEQLVVLEHLAGHVDAVRVRAGDVGHRELRARHGDGQLRVGAVAVALREAHRHRGVELRRFRIGDDHRLEEQLHRLLGDRRRLEDRRLGPGEHPGAFDHRAQAIGVLAVDVDQRLHELPPFHVHKEHLGDALLLADRDGQQVLQRFVEVAPARLPQHVVDAVLRNVEEDVGGAAVRQPVVMPHLHRLDVVVTVGIEDLRGLAVDDVDGVAIGMLAILLRRLRDQLVVFGAERLPGGAGRRVALPEGVDEDVALRVGLQVQERVFLGRLDDRPDVEQELPIDGGKILDALLALGAGELGLSRKARRQREQRERDAESANHRQLTDSTRVWSSPSLRSPARSPRATCRRA